MISPEIGREVDAARLLEVGELRDLLPVEQHLPADAPGPEGRRLPVVLLEADVVGRGIDAERAQAAEVEVLDVGRRRLQDHLELLVLVEAVRVLAVAAVGGPARGLHVGDAPGLGAEHAQEGLGVHGPRAHLRVPGLVDEAAAIGPVVLEGEHDLLQRHRAVRSRATSLQHALRPQVALQMARDEVLVKAFQGRASVGTGRRRSGGERRNTSLRKARAAAGSTGPEAGPQSSHTKPCAASWYRSAPGGSTAAAARAAVEGRVDAVQRSSQASR